MRTTDIVALAPSSPPPQQRSRSSEPDAVLPQDSVSIGSWELDYGYRPSYFGYRERPTELMERVSSTLAGYRHWASDIGLRMRDEASRYMNGPETRRTVGDASASQVQETYLETLLVTLEEHSEWGDRSPHEVAKETFQAVVGRAEKCASTTRALAAFVDILKLERDLQKEEKGNPQFRDIVKNAREGFEAVCASDGADMARSLEDYKALRTMLPSYCMDSVPPGLAYLARGMDGEAREAYLNLVKTSRRHASAESAVVQLYAARSLLAEAGERAEIGELAGIWTRIHDGDKDNLFTTNTSLYFDEVVKPHGETLAERLAIFSAMQTHHKPSHETEKLREMYSFVVSTFADEDRKLYVEAYRNSSPFGEGLLRLYWEREVKDRPDARNRLILLRACCTDPTGGDADPLSAATELSKGLQEGEAPDELLSAFARFRSFPNLNTYSAASVAATWTKLRPEQRPAFERMAARTDGWRVGQAIDACLVDGGALFEQKTELFLREDEKHWSQIAVYLSSAGSHVPPDVDVPRGTVAIAPVAAHKGKEGVERLLRRLERDAAGASTDHRTEYLELLARAMSGAKSDDDFERTVDFVLRSRTRPESAASVERQEGAVVIGGIRVPRRAV